MIYVWDGQHEKVKILKNYLVVLLALMEFIHGWP